MDKRSAENYQVEHFIADESFINYHFKSNNADRLFWEKWVTAHTAKRHLVNEARDMLDTLSLGMSDKEYREELDKIYAAIRANQPPAIVRLTGKLPE